jgi:catechol 2,3-dioxygenase-like lactoylglutathione lyase family enzyme
VVSARRLLVVPAGHELNSVRDVPITLENVGIAVRDIEAATAFFTDLGLTVLGRTTVSGEWTEAVEAQPTRPHEIGMHRVAFAVDDIDEALAIAARWPRI